MSNQTKLQRVILDLEELSEEIRSIEKKKEIEEIINNLRKVILYE